MGKRGQSVIYPGEFCQGNARINAHGRHWLYFYLLWAICWQLETVLFGLDCPKLVNVQPLPAAGIYSGIFHGKHSNVNTRGPWFCTLWRLTFYTIYFIQWLCKLMEASSMGHYDNTYKNFTHNDLTYNINKCGITLNGIY